MPRHAGDPNYGQPGYVPPDGNGGGGESLTPDYSSIGSGSGDGTNGQGGLYGGGGPNGAGAAPMPPPGQGGNPGPPSFADQQAPYIDGSGYDNGPWNEFTAAADAHQADTRQAPQTNWIQSQQSRGLQMQDANSYLDVLNGKAPSLAQMQMQQGLSSAAMNASDLAASTRGGGGNILLSEGMAQRQNATSAQGAILQSAELRAKEDDMARSGLSGISSNMRGQDQGQGEFGTDTQLKQEGLNDTRFQNDMQGSQHALDTRAGFVPASINAQANAAAAQEKAKQDTIGNYIDTSKAIVGTFSGASAAKATGALSQQGVNLPQKQQGLGGSNFLGNGGGSGGGSSAPSFGAVYGGSTPPPSGGSGGSGGAPNTFGGSPSYGGGGFASPSPATYSDPSGTRPPPSGLSAAYQGRGLMGSQPGTYAGPSGTPTPASMAQPAPTSGAGLMGASSGRPPAGGLASYLPNGGRPPSTYRP